MTILRHKLKSNKGVSIIIALLFFLLAFMVTAVIITATVANTNRIEKIREEKQTYLTTLSVANMIKETLDSSTIRIRVIDVSYTHECRQHSDAGTASSHKENSFTVPSSNSYYTDLYDNSKYSDSSKIVFLIQNGVEYGFNDTTKTVNAQNVDFDLIEKAIAEMVYQVAISGDSKATRHIGCDATGIVSDKYDISITVEMNSNFDLSFTVGTVCESTDTSYYMTIKTRTISSVPSFLRDEFTEYHLDSLTNTNVQYSVYFDKTQTDYDWDVIAYIKGGNQ